MIGGININKLPPPACHQVCMFMTVVTAIISGGADFDKVGFMAGFESGFKAGHEAGFKAGSNTGRNNQPGVYFGNYSNFNNYSNFSNYSIFSNYGNSFGFGIPSLPSSDLGSIPAATTSFW